METPSSEQHDPGGNGKALLAIEDHRYPTLPRRYIAAAIDGSFVIAAIILISYIFENASPTGVKVRVALILFLFFIYEPLFTSRLCTLGQKIMSVRVRHYPSMERLSFPMAYARFIIKGLFGILSFFTVPFSHNRRAIHDMVARSIVIFPDAQGACETNAIVS